MDEAHDGVMGERAFSAGDFRVPLRYLSLLVGEQSAERLLARAQIAPHANEPAYLPSVTFLNLCLEHMRNAEDESYGAAATPAPRGTFGLLMAAASQADAFAGALQRFADAAKILRPDLSIKFQRTRERLQLTIIAQPPRTAHKEFMTEIFAVTTQCAFRWLTGARLRPLHVRICEPMPAFERSVLSVFCCPTPPQGEGVSICYAPQDAGIPILPVKYQHWAAHELGEFMRLLEEAAQEINSARPSPNAMIVARVANLIAEGVHNEYAAAAKLGMSTASLRRRMSEFGCTFRSVLADYQRNAAASLLATDKSLDDIAAELGFSDTRSLRRACQRWFGMTPTEYRRGQSAGGRAA